MAASNKIKPLLESNLKIKIMIMILWSASGIWVKHCEQDAFFQLFFFLLHTFCVHMDVIHWY